jgi:hypothetical protein
MLTACALPPALLEGGPQGVRVVVVPLQAPGAPDMAARGACGASLQELLAAALSGERTPAGTPRI